MKLVKTTEAVGHVLCHDITRIVKDVVKDAIFRKGHVVTKEDIPLLLSMGKEHLYVWEKDESMLHENEAAEILCGICQNEYMYPTPVKEGKIELVADRNGLFLVDVERLDAINDLDQVMIATRHSGTAVKKGDHLLGTRVIPLVIEKKKMEQVKESAGEKPLTELKPFLPLKAGIITTGNEILKNRVQDTFTPIVKEKLQVYGIKTIWHELCGDDRKRITETILKMKEEGADLIICTGGMSVDPDDRTPGAIRDTGVEVVSYGAPVLPGAMFLISYFEDGVPVLGLPGCVMYQKATVFDLVLPRIAAGVKITRRDITRLGNGGLCLGCETCHFPDCGFGKN